MPDDIVNNWSLFCHLKSDNSDWSASLTATSPPQSPSSTGEESEEDPSKALQSLLSQNMIGQYQLEIFNISLNIILNIAAGFNPMLLTAQVALAVQNKQNNPFLSAYTNLLANSGILPSIMAERIKSARFSPYSIKEKSFTPSASSATAAETTTTTATATIKASVLSRVQTGVRRVLRSMSGIFYFSLVGEEP